MPEIQGNLVRERLGVLDALSSPLPRGEIFALDLRMRRIVRERPFG